MSAGLYGKSSAYGEDSEDAKFPDEIKADVEALAEALVERSGYYSDAYAGEDLGFPPHDLAIPPGSGAPTDNEIEDFYWARETIGREVPRSIVSRLGPGQLPPIPLKRGVAVGRGLPQRRARDVAKVTASLAKHTT